MAEPDFLARLLDEMSDGVYFVDLDRTITYWNKGAERITGYCADEVLGRRCADDLLIHVDGCGNRLCQDGCPLSSVIRGNQTGAIEIFLHHRDGHRVPVLVRASPVHDEDGQILGAVEIFSDNSAKIAALEHVHELEHDVYFDPLTELPNRRFGESFLAARLDEQRRHGWPYGVIMIDIDHFKSVNDALGHQTGDEVLRIVARSFAGAIRSSDIVCRWGGEEFLVILTNPDAQQLQTIATRLWGLVRSSPVSVAKHRLNITVSVGAVLAHEGSSPALAIARADELLYQSKRNGRDRVTCEHGSWGEVA